MKTSIAALAFLAAFGVALDAQAQVTTTSAAGPYPTPLINRTGTSNPSTCQVGELYFRSDATAGQNLYMCASANTWTQQLNSGAAGGLTIGTSTITSGTTTRVLYDNAGVVGEYSITGTGNVVMSASPTISSPTVTGTAVTFTSGTSRTLANASEIIVCTSTCTITPPASATAGMQFCVQNDDNVSTIITLAAVSGVQYEAQARTSYGTANHTMTSGGAVKDQICMVAVSATKWNVFSSVGSWTNN